MSKKIMKRSLALGALMAFVITGNAWAAEPTKLEADLEVTSVPQHAANYDLQEYTFKVINDSGSAVHSGNDFAGYNFVGTENSKLKLTGAYEGLSGHGKVDVGDIEVSAGGNAVYVCNQTEIRAGTIDLSANASGVYVDPEAIGGTLVTIGFDESLTIKGTNGVVSRGYNGIVDVGGFTGSTLVIDADERAVYADSNSKVYINTALKQIGGKLQLEYLGCDNSTIKGDVEAYGNAEINLGLKGEQSKFTGKVVTGENATTNLILEGGTWNITDDSVVSGIVVNGDVTIDGAKADGSAEDNKYSMSLNRKLNIYNKYLINHTSGTLKINNLIIDGIEKVTTSGNSNGSVINGSGNADLLLITNSVISNNKNVCSEGLNWSSSLKPYAVIDVSSNMNIENTTFENNETDYMGGALYLHTKEFNITGSVFENNSADQGAAIQTNTATVNLKGKNTFKGNTSKKASNDSGGAITTQGGTMNFLGETTFEENQALNGNGGAINSYYDNSTMNFVEKSNTFFRDNYAKLVGGAIHNNSTSILNFNGTAEFTNNEAGNEGGAIYNDSIVNFNYGSTTVFSGNTANGIANDIYNAGIININQGAKVTLDGGITGSGTTNINGGNLVLKGGTTYVETLGGDGGIIRFESADAKLEVNTNNNDTLKFTATSAVNEAVAGDANALVSGVDWSADTTMIMEAGDIVGEITAELGENKDTGKLVVKSQTEAANPANQAISDAGVGLKLHYRYHMNDMNKRMGELRNANGEHGVWTRMVRGECEYENSKAQYNQYQLGYDEKLSVDKRWTVGAAVTFSEGDSSYGYGSTEDKSTAFAIYGSKLNNDGTFVDLIARYAHLESDIEDKAGKGDYSTNGMSVSAEFGKRIQQSNGLWIEPQFELTYGNIDSAEFQIGGKTVQVGDMDSLIARAGFALGKDIKQGNVYARASYLYDFDGETETAFSNSSATRTFKDDLGGGWWEVGVGANINLSKATYIYADVEKTFGGEVDTNWQWNLGVRYSF